MELENAAPDTVLPFVLPNAFLKKGVLKMSPKCMVNPKSGSYEQFTHWEGRHKGQLENIKLETPQEEEISAAECVPNKMLSAIFESSKPKLCSIR